MIFKRGEVVVIYNFPDIWSANTVFKRNVYLRLSWRRTILGVFSRWTLTFYKFQKVQHKSVIWMYARLPKNKGCNKELVRNFAVMYFSNAHKWVETVCK